MKTLLGIFLCGALTLSAAIKPTPPATPQEPGVWSFAADQWSRKEAKVWKGMTHAEVVTAMGKWYSAKTPKNEPEVTILRFYRDTVGPVAVENTAGSSGLNKKFRYSTHEDRIEVLIKSGLLVDVVVTRGPDRDHVELSGGMITSFENSQNFPSNGNWGPTLPPPPLQ